MLKPILRAALAVLVLLGVSSPLFGDVIHLKNGGQVEGTVKEQGDSYRIENRFGHVLVKKAEVASIEKKETLLERYEKRRAKIDEKDPDAHVALGEWLRENGWEAKAREEFRAALALDPDHRGAHGALGHVFYEGAWRTEDEIMELKGFVRYEGKWVTEEERARRIAVAEREKAARERRQELLELKRRMQKDLQLIAYGTGKQCAKAYDDLVTLARERKDEKLEKFAGDVKAYFDKYWEIVRQQNALTEVQATISTLKRPIPTFTTSLGAGSTPVTLQLPELTIWSVKTTVPVPAGR